MRYMLIWWYEEIHSLQCSLFLVYWKITWIYKCVFLRVFVYVSVWPYVWVWMYICITIVTYSLNPNNIEFIETAADMYNLPQPPKLYIENFTKITEHILSTHLVLESNNISNLIKWTSTHWVKYILCGLCNPEKLSPLKHECKPLDEHAKLISSCFHMHRNYFRYYKGIVTEVILDRKWIWNIMLSFQYSTLLK